MVAVVLIQPQPRAGLAAARLAGRGVRPIELAFHKLSAIDNAVASLRELDITRFDRVVFVSPSSVSFSADALRGRLGPETVAAIGQGTATVLLECELVARDDEIIRPRESPFDSAALVALPQMQPSVVRNVLVIRGRDGRTDWLDRYERAGVHLNRADIYATQAIQPESSVRDELLRMSRADQSAVLVIGSISELQSLLRWRDAQDNGALTRWLHSRPAIVPHARIGRDLSTAGWTDVRSVPAGQTLLDAALELAATL